jgi:hypothetical protein
VGETALQPHRIILIGLIVLPMLLSAHVASQSAWATETVVPAASSLTDSHGSALQVSENGRHLIDRDGKPFFWLGDTAWLLFQMTTRDDAEWYLKTRAEQGFTVIQAAVVMGEERVGGTLRPNLYGDVAFVGGFLAGTTRTIRRPSGKSGRKSRAESPWARPIRMIFARP